MPQEAQHLLAWNDVIKLVVGFGISLILIWAKSEGERLHRLKTLKRSAWNVAKHHTNLEEMLTDLDEAAQHAKHGNVWISFVDLCEHYSAIVSELSRLDPKHADTYISYLSSEAVVRKGYLHLSSLKTELIKARTATPCPEGEATSIRSAIGAQCIALKRDLRLMAERELKLLKLIEIRRSDAINPLTQLEEAIRKLDSELGTAHG